MPFTSVVSLDLSDCIARHLVHVAYGVGKDFCASGLRIGVLLSRNDGLISAVSSIRQDAHFPLSVTQTIVGS